MNGTPHKMIELARSSGTDAAAAAMEPQVFTPWAQANDELFAELASGIAGLTDDEAKKRLLRDGPNQRSTRPRSVWSILLAQVKSLIVVLLGAACVASLAFGEYVEAACIAVVLVLNGAIGFYTELRAVRSMEALRRLGTHSVRVRREARERMVPGTELVVGDVVLLEGGDVVTADMRVVEASKLSADESTLTGESVPVSKHAGLMPKAVSLAERANMLYKGTALTRGSGLAVVVAIGMKSELGRIAQLVRDASQTETPLEERLESLGQRLIWGALVVGIVATFAGLAGGKSLLLMIETGIALAVAAIPEGLPIVATMALARGMWRMARRDALINHLAAVETLGATTVIVTDKTGTLTENQMTVVRLVTSEGITEVTGEGLSIDGSFVRDGQAVDPTSSQPLRAVLEISVLCNNASFTEAPLASEDGASGVGDPLEVALLVLGRKAGLVRGELMQGEPEVREEAFDPESRMMATFHRRGAEGAARVAVKGAVGAVLKHCDSFLGAQGTVHELTDGERARWLELNQAMAREGLRVLAFAQRTTASEEDPPYQDLILVGLVAMRDPPRAGVSEAIRAAKKAGVRVVMATGDQAVTAHAIAYATGLVDSADSCAVTGAELGRLQTRPANEQEAVLASAIFARVDPEQKLDLIAAYQAHGEVVAMTGDGVNDAPALRKADIGIAMGKRGTDVAREAADMVLTDDSMSSIVFAIGQGRVIYDNIQKFVRYLLSCNTAEILAISLALGAALPLPILPLQILFLNLVTDVFPALALGFSGASSHVMARAPRARDEQLLTRAHWLEIGVYALSIAVPVIVSLYVAQELLHCDSVGATSISFLTLAFAQLWHVINVRDRHSSFFDNEITRNRWMWGAIFLCVGLLLLSVYLSPLARVLQTSAPDLRGWAVVLGFSFVPVAFGQLWRVLRGGASGTAPLRQELGASTSRLLKKSPFQEICFVI